MLSGLHTVIFHPQLRKKKESVQLLHHRFKVFHIYGTVWTYWVNFPSFRVFSQWCFSLTRPPTCSRCLWPPGEFSWCGERGTPGGQSAGVSCSGYHGCTTAKNKTQRNCKTRFIYTTKGPWTVSPAKSEETGKKLWIKFYILMISFQTGAIFHQTS